MSDTDKLQQKVIALEYQVENLTMTLNKVMEMMKKVNMVEEDTYEVTSLETRLLNMECRIDNLEYR